MFFTRPAELSANALDAARRGFLDAFCSEVLVEVEDREAKDRKVAVNGVVSVLQNARRRFGAEDSSASP